MSVNIAVVRIFELWLIKSLVPDCLGECAIMGDTVYKLVRREVGNFTLFSGSVVQYKYFQIIHSFFHSFIYPFTARVVGAPQMISQPVFPFSPVPQCPLGLGEFQACPFPDFVFPPVPLSALSSSPFHCALQDGFAKTWWTGDMTIPLQFASLYCGQEVFVWSDSHFHTFR